MNFHLKKSLIAILLVLIITPIILIIMNSQVLAKLLKQGEVYSSLDGREVIEVISSNELEVKKHGDIIVATYNIKDDKVRVVYKILDTKIIEYYEIIEEGLRGKSRNILYSKEGKLKWEAARAKAAAEAEATRVKKLEEAVFYDKNTNLEWLAGPNKMTNFSMAKEWVEGLTAVAGGGWRMPTVDELKTLHKLGIGSRDKKSLLKTNICFVWSGKTKDSTSAYTFDFQSGTKDVVSTEELVHLKGRGLAVRPRK